jgi:CxC2 like cysteine cluster associated with KDZ transposases
MYRHRQTQQNYVLQYVDRIDEILMALQSREAMPEGTGMCRHCNKSIAVWRCKECVMATPMCRACMRQSHKENHLHRIQKWNGSFFQPAELWEVGIYILIPHHTGKPICDTLRKWCDLLDSSEETEDVIEQERLRWATPAPVPDIEFDMDVDDDGNRFDDDEESGGDIGDESDEEEDLDHDQPAFTTGPGTGPGPHPGLSSTLRSFIRVVHTNGLHQIPMVSCKCQGEDILPLDLFAAHLLPTSFKRIKTLFTSHVLDMFRLSNLELKASAYQYYHLLCRLTRPMAPTEVLNLYKEFRRMSRLWRWMKKLKWAGYAGGRKSVSEVKTGELGNFCPACPQPGINIPDNWKDDTARYVL